MHVPEGKEQRAVNNRKTIARSLPLARMFYARLSHSRLDFVLHA